MMKYKIIGVLMVLAFAKAETLKSQNIKIERESRIEYSEFPQQAAPWISVLSQDCDNKKFYKETDGEKTSYELKCKCGGRSRSIEFSEYGALEDVEITIKKRKIEQNTRKKINSTLDSIARKNRIEKVQLQFLPSSNNPADIARNIELKKLDNYELIVAFKEKRKIYRKELLFDRDGNLLTSRDIKRLEYDFLLF